MKEFIEYIIVFMHLYIYCGGKLVSVLTYHLLKPKNLSLSFYKALLTNQNWVFEYTEAVLNEFKMNTCISHLFHLFLFGQSCTE